MNYKTINVEFSYVHQVFAHINNHQAISNSKSDTITTHKQEKEEFKTKEDNKKRV